MKLSCKALDEVKEDNYIFFTIKLKNLANPKLISKLANLDKEFKVILWSDKDKQPKKNILNLHIDSGFVAVNSDNSMKKNGIFI